MTGRPDETEAAAYYFTYINKVKGDEPLSAIEEQLEEALAVFAGISEEKSLHRYAPGKWSIREALNHLSDTERAFSFRALWFARGFGPSLPGFDQNVGVAGGSADRVAWSDHIEEFRRVRLSTIALFRNLPEEAWGREGIASDNRVTVRALAFMIPGHVAHHLGVLRERYL